MAINGQSEKISTREIDQLLKKQDSGWLADNCVVESRIDEGHRSLYVHLADQTLVYDLAASAVLQEPVWFTIDSGNEVTERYRARGLVWCYDKWIVGDPSSGAYGYLTDANSYHYGQAVGWEFGTAVLYNEGRGAILHELELVTLTGRVDSDADPVVWTSYSKDGETWSQERPKRAGKRGERNVRLTWLQQGHMRHWRIQRFRGTSDAFLSFARLEAQLEALNV
jgi:hypothetical protein